MKRLLLILLFPVAGVYGQVAAPPEAIANWSTANTALTLADPSATNQVAGWDNVAKKWVWVTAGAGGGGNVSNSGTPTAGQLAQWTSATLIKGVTLSGSGATISIDTSGVLTISAIPNTSLSNSSITIAGTSTALGGTISRDTITGVSSNGIYQRTATNTYGIAVAKTDYWDTSNFVASGASHAKGLVPDPGASAGTTKFLREDATWQVPAGGGSGTVTNAANLANNSVVLGDAGTVGVKTSTGFTTDGAGVLTLGVGSTAGGLAIRNTNNSAITIVRGGIAAPTYTLTLPDGNNDNLVGRQSTDTLTNKTLTTPHISSTTNVVFDTSGGGTVSIAAAGTTGTRIFTLPNSPDDTFVFKATGDTLTNKTLTTPHITSGTNVVFDASGGGTISIAAAGTSGTRVFTLPNSPSDTIALAGDVAAAVSDTAFASSWDAVTTIAPSKNAVYDALHAFDTNDNGKVNVLDQGTGITNTNSTGVIQTALTAPSGTIVGTTDTQTLTNKRINPRVDNSTAGSATTWAPNADTTDVFELAGVLTVAVTTISNPSGTPVEGQKLMFRIKSDASARALTWSGTQWRASTASGAPALPGTTTASKNLVIGFMWNSTDSKWDLLAVQDGY